MKVDIFNAYIALLKQTRPLINSSVQENEMDHSESLADTLRGEVAKIVPSLHKQLREKSIKTRQSCFFLLTELVHVMPGCLQDHVSTLTPGLLYSLR